MRRLSFLLAASAFLCAGVHAQDAPSLGDVARQTRLQKQQKAATAQAAQSQNAPNTQSSGSSSSDSSQAKSSRVVTNEDIPEHTAPTKSYEPGSVPDEPSLSTVPVDRETEAQHWKSDIQSQKNAIASLQHEIDNLGSSIHYASGNCASNCVQWNERQQKKQEQAEKMKAQLDEQQKKLEEMQEAARKQGFGDSVYDP